MTGYRDLDNLLWALLQFVRSAPMGGQYIARVMTREEKPTRHKYFTKAQLKRAAQIAFERDYNRQLDLDVVDQLQGRNFPISFALPHEHAKGQSVPLHMRCLVILDAEGGQGFLDTDMDLYTSLSEWEVPDPRRIATPSAN
jgi:hypothetical protein